MEILTSLQIEIIKEISKTSLQKDFFLTGGTALSALYLKHRYSDDLDFFTEDPHAVRRVADDMRKVASSVGLEVQFRRVLEHFMECFFIGRNEERVELDFALDSPYRLEPKRLSNELGIWVDNPLDISCNKLSALFDRADAKDFVDIYFIDKELYKFEKILEKAREKHVGIDDYWLTQALTRIKGITKLPRMIKEITIEELRIFFEGKIKNLMNL